MELYTYKGKFYYRHSPILFTKIVLIKKTVSFLGIKLIDKWVEGVIYTPQLDDHGGDVRLVYVRELNDFNKKFKKVKSS